MPQNSLAKAAAAIYLIIFASKDVIVYVMRLLSLPLQVKQTLARQLCADYKFCHPTVSVHTLIQPYTICPLTPSAHKPAHHLSFYLTGSYTGSHPHFVYHTMDLCLIAGFARSLFGKPNRKDLQQKSKFCQNRSPKEKNKNLLQRAKIAIFSHLRQKTQFFGFYHPKAKKKQKKK